MGECLYLLKAKFATHGKAQIAAKKLVKTLSELDEAYSFWQKNRGKTPAEFWSEFEAKFPLALEILKVTPGMEIGGDCNNGLAGKLSYCGNDRQVEVLGNEIKYSEEVWHFASWTGLEIWIKKVLKAKAVVWASESNAAGDP